MTGLRRLMGRFGPFGVCLAIAGGCASPAEAPADRDQGRGSDVQRELRRGETAGAYLRQEQRDFLETAEAQLTTLEAQVDALDERIEAAGAAAATRMEEAMGRLRAEAAELRQQVHEASADGALAWEDVQDGLSAALAELERAYDQAIARFES